MLNIDWFNPFVRGQYSVGAVYLTLLNLPRTLRYKKEYMILVALLPGGKEKEHDLNKLLEPLVDELLELLGGVLFTSPSGNVRIRAFLHLVSCDLPAARKLCGFKSHNYCCSRCIKTFTRFDTGEVSKNGNPVYGWDKSGSDWNN